MNNIAEIILTDGEVIPASNLGSQKEFEFKVLNSLDFENIKTFFIKKSIIEAIKQKHNLTNGSNGATTIELLNLFKWDDIELYIKELEEKNIILKKKGENLEIYLINKK